MLELADCECQLLAGCRRAACEPHREGLEPPRRPVVAASSAGASRAAIDEPEVYDKYSEAEVKVMFAELAQQPVGDELDVLRHLAGVHPDEVDGERVGDEGALDLDGLAHDLRDALGRRRPLQVQRLRTRSVARTVGHRAPQTTLRDASDRWHTAEGRAIDTLRPW